MLTNKEIGKRIEELRTKHGFSQANLATFLGIDQSLVSRIERGERTLNESLLDQLSALFGITVEELTEGTGKTTGICCALRASDINADDMCNESDCVKCGNVVIVAEPEVRGVWIKANCRGEQPWQGGINWGQMNSPQLIFFP